MKILIIIGIAALFAIFHNKKPQVPVARLTAKEYAQNFKNYEGKIVEVTSKIVSIPPGSIDFPYLQLEDNVQCSVSSAMDCKIGQDITVIGKASESFMVYDCDIK